MPFNRPTLSGLLDRIRDDFNGRLPGADSRVRRSVLDVLARMHAAVAHGLHGYQAWIAKQILPDTSDAEILARQAAIWGITPLAATPASGRAVFTGADGSPVRSGTALLRSDGVEYATTAAATIVAGVATVDVVAIVAGQIGNAPAGQALALVSPVPGVVATATVASGAIGGGADEEAEDSLRARLLDRIRRPPHGGSESDYERWAKEVAGVTRAWVYPGQLGPGTVSVTFVCDHREDIIPTETDVEAVDAHIGTLRPVTAAVTVFAPVPRALELTIRAVPPTLEVEMAITAEIEDLLAREAEPGGTILISHIREAISLAAGEMDHELIAPGGDVTADPGQLWVPGLISWADA